MALISLISLKLQCYTVWMMHHTILRRGCVLKVLASPIQGHTSILESDSNQNGTHLLLTDNNICHNIVCPIHFLQACRKCTWKPYVLSYLVMQARVEKMCNFTFKSLTDRRNASILGLTCRLLAGEGRGSLQSFCP